MGNSVSFGGALPCTCLHSRKVLPVADEPVHINGNGHISTNSAGANNGGVSRLTTGAANGHVKDGPTGASPAYINSASLASPQLQTHARDTFSMCLLLIGLDGSGKTSFLRWLTQKYPAAGRNRRSSQAGRGSVTTDWVDCKPTLGFSKENVRVKKHQIVVHDLGGGPTIRGIWKNYFAEAHGIVLMVDSSVPPSNSKWEELNDVIDNLIVSDDSGLQARPLLVLLNKQDTKPCMDVEDFKSVVKISTLAEEYSMPFRIIPVCVREQHLILNPAVRQQVCTKSLEDSVQWLIKSVELHFPILHMKVQQDTRAQIARDEQLRQLRSVRLKAAREAQEAEEDAAESEEIFKELGADGSPFIPLEEHLQRVEERRRSSAAPAVSVELVEATSLKASHSEPSLSRLSDHYSSSDILMASPLPARAADVRRRSNPEVVSAAGDAAPDGAVVPPSIGDISDDDDLEKLAVGGLREKTSRPPVYKRLAHLSTDSTQAV